MTRCKLCRKEIPDGTEYCKDCLDKKKSKTNETYLDSLLNSVINTPNVGTNLEKSDRSKSKDTQSSNKQQENKSSEEFYDTEDVDDFDKFNINEDLDSDLSNELNDPDGEAGADLKDSLPDDIRKDLKDDIHIDENELFGDNLSDLLYDEDTPDENNQKKMSETEKADSNQDIEESNEKSEVMNNESKPEVKTAENEADNGDQNQKHEPIQNNILPDEIKDFKEDDGIDPSLDDLLHELETSDENQGGASDKNDDIPKSDLSEPMGEKKLTEEGETEQEKATHQEEEVSQEKEPVNAEDNEQKDETEAVTDDDFFSLLNQIDTDDPVADDVKAIGDLLNESGQEKKEESPNDVGGVFSDALKVVTSLHDPLEDEVGIGQLSDTEDKKGKKKGKKKDKKDKKKDKKSKKDKKKEKNTSADGKEAKPKKKGIFAKLFGKSKEGKTENKANPDEAAAKGDIAVPKGANKKKTAKKKIDKKDKKDKKAEKEKASKQSKTASKTKGAFDNSSQKEASKSDKSNKENTKGQDNKKEIKKQDKEAIQVIDEIEDEGKINRAGAFTVFLFFGLIVLLILAGTNIFSYTMSIKNAQSYFDTRKYNEAYNEVYGMDIKAKDLETYDKIMTVMFVNKQLNSYNNYYTIKQYPEALDALLKGLKRYDKYVTLANMLGIKSDLDYVRKQILSELDRVFNLSEKDAMKIIKCKTQSQYSMSVYNAVIENMKNDHNLTVKE